jgi:dihydrodipicolinate reductase
LVSTARSHRPGTAFAALEAIGEQRTAEARGGEPMLTTDIPNTVEEGNRQASTMWISSVRGPGIREDRAVFAEHL